MEDNEILTTDDSGSDIPEVDSSHVSDEEKLLDALGEENADGEVLKYDSPYLSNSSSLSPNVTDISSQILVI